MGFQVVLVTDVEDAQDEAAAVRAVITDLSRGLEFNFDVRPLGADVDCAPVVISNVDAFKDEQ